MGGLRWQRCLVSAFRLPQGLPQSKCRALDSILAAGLSRVQAPGRGREQRGGRGRGRGREGPVL